MQPMSSHGRHFEAASKSKVELGPPARERPPSLPLASWSPAIRILQHWIDRPQTAPWMAFRPNSMIASRRLPSFPSLSPHGPNLTLPTCEFTLILGRLSIIAVSNASCPRLRLCTPTMLFTRRALPHPGLWLWGPRGTFCPDPDLARDGMLQDASALDCEWTWSHGRREESTWRRRIKTTYQNHLRRGQGIMVLRSLGSMPPRTSWNPGHTC
jgi:hypothetical protein